MAKVSVRLEPIDKSTINVLLDDVLSPKAQSFVIAAVAKDERNKAIAINRRALGREPTYSTWVDGRLNASLESVKPNGHILFVFDLLLDTFGWIGQQLVERSPIGDPPLHYFENHLFFADGIQIMPGQKVPPADVYEFVNAVPYARKIERGLSPQAPDGVYQVIAAMAQKKFGKVARVRFSYRSLTGNQTANTTALKDTRQPAIIITMPRERR